ncbi:hypothetical protein T03_11825 [Trichinella britovi]|uniref:Uncharacterized protein n=1 Tax=Trichinella britovi TaxID=45882 RepID=A0A0V1AJK7_TRIBR|nr:hypothetical protein T03_11825 [Trichinella britovi]
MPYINGTNEKNDFRWKLVCLMDRGKARSIKSGLRAIEILSKDELLPSHN